MDEEAGGTATLGGSTGDGEVSGSTNFCNLFVLFQNKYDKMRVKNTQHARFEVYLDGCRNCFSSL